MSRHAGAEEPQPGRIARAVRSCVVAPLVVYRALVSPLLGPRCRYVPSCSLYAEQAIRRYGVGRGLVLAAWRVLRCNPFSEGGFDAVEDQRLFGRRRRHDQSCRHATMSGGG